MNTLDRLSTRFLGSRIDTRSKQYKHMLENEILPNDLVIAMGQNTDADIETLFRFDIEEVTV